MSFMRRLGAGLLAPLLLTGAVAHAATLYRCGMDGAVRRSCCCPTAEAADGTAPKALTRPSCCTVEPIPPGQAPTTPPPRDSEVRSLAIAALLLPLGVSPAPTVALLRPTAIHSRVGPPIIALKSSRLI